MTLHERLLRMVEAVPEEGQVVLPITVLRRWLAADSAGVEHVEAGPAGSAEGLPDPGLTVAQVAAHIGREESTIRGWVGEGRFPGAFKLGREWRIPREDLAQALNTGGGNEAGRAREPEITGRGDLAAWRKERAR